MNSSNPQTDTISSPPSSSPVPSPRTDTVQYTQGDWHNMTCSPSNCTINTISPHHQNHQPPNVNYTPQFDYELNPNMSPLLTMTSPYNYPNPNMTFYNPYMAKSCKRALNTSGSSVSSRHSPQTKRPRHNLSTCSSSTNKSLVSCSSLEKTRDQLDLDKTWVPTDLDEEHTEDIPDCSNNNLLCQNCPDLQPVVAVCRSCPDQPAICQLCLDAHKRVRLTREHSMHMLEEDLVTLHTEGCRSLPQVLQSIVELIDIEKKLSQVDLNDTLASTTAELVRTWSVASDKSSNTDIRLALDELFPPFVAQLDSRVRLGRLSADHQCIVSLRDTLGQNVKLSWPDMPIEEDLFRGLKRIP